METATGRLFVALYALTHRIAPGPKDIKLGVGHDLAEGGALLSRIRQGLGEGGGGS